MRLHCFCSVCYYRDSRYAITRTSTRQRYRSSYSCGFLWLYRCYRYVKNVNIHMMRLASRYGVPNSVPSETDTDTLVCITPRECTLPEAVAVQGTNHVVHVAAVSCS